MCRAPVSGAGTHRWGHGRISKQAQEDESTCENSCRVRLGFGVAGAAADCLTRDERVARSRVMDIDLDVLLALPHEERVVLLRRLLSGDEVDKTVVIAATVLRRSRRSGLAELGF